MGRRYRKRKPKSVIGMLLSICISPIVLMYDLSISYRPYNSTGAKISRAKKKKWF